MKQPVNKTGIQNQSGISLVELMIAITISLLLLASVLHLFTSSKYTYTVLTGISRLQEGGRISIERMKYNMRLAGYMGCSNLGATTPNNVSGESVFTDIVTIQGSNNVTAGTPGVDPVSSTDTLTLVFAKPSRTEMSMNMPSDTTAIPINGNPDNYQAGDYLLITDCEQADILQATGVSATQISHSSTLSKAYLSNALIMKLESLTYSVMDTGRMDRHGNPVISLFETRLDGAAVETVKGVEDMQITYGVDTDGDSMVEIYQTAAEVADWDEIISLRVALLISTAEGVGNENRSYIFQGTTVTNRGDYRIRREFSTAIALRNRSI